MSTEVLFQDTIEASNAFYFISKLSHDKTLKGLEHVFMVKENSTICKVFTVSYSSKSTEMCHYISHSWEKNTEVALIQSSTHTNLVKTSAQG